jgi:hypothetical protein
MTIYVGMAYRWIYSAGTAAYDPQTLTVSRDEESLQHHLEYLVGNSGGDYASFSIWERALP